MELRPYQIPIFNDNTTGILGLHWARQLGKSTVLVMKHIEKLKSSGVLQIEDRSEAAKKIREICSANTKEQLEAAALATT